MEFLRSLRCLLFSLGVFFALGYTAVFGAGKSPSVGTDDVQMLVTRICATAVFSLTIILGDKQLKAAPTTMVIPHLDQGWYTNAGFHDPFNQNFVAGDGRGSICEHCKDDLRNFFVFHLSGVEHTILSATLAIKNPEYQGYDSNDVSENFELHDVQTAITSLLDGTAGIAAHEDLGRGVVYGNLEMTENEDGRIDEILLNSAAIADLNSADDLFAIGGSITTLDSLPNYEVVFAFSGVFGVSELRLTLVPEPSSGLLCCAAFIPLIPRSRRLWLR